MNTPRQIPAVVGYFDRIVDESAYGWAYQPTAPGKRLVVEVVCDGNVVGRGEAALLRDDLVEAGIGDGYHHFELPVSCELYDGQPHPLTVRDAASGITLSGGPHTFTAAPQARIAEMISRDQGVFLLRDLLLQAAFTQHRPRAARIFQAFLYASLLQETGEAEQARVAYEAIAQGLGPNALCHCKIAETWLLQNDHAKTLQAYQQAASEDPRLHWAHLGIGNAHRLLGDPIAAEEALQTALALQPDSQDVQARLAQVQAEAIPARTRSLVDSGKRDEAIQVLKELVLANPEHPVAVPALVKLLSRLPEDSTLPGMRELREHQGAYLLLQLVLDEADKRKEAKGK